MKIGTATIQLQLPVQEWTPAQDLIIKFLQMANAIEKTARIISSGSIVKVYKHKLSDKWILSADCSTMYKPKELDFKNITQEQTEVTC